ncbi:MULTISPECIES: hypothetical protein [unclassified Streptomyces]|uniref:hypothetical protein n=1 Tax=unclassified Streptomyces TaxID=2593676 RepID=UPI003330B75B
MNLRTKAAATAVTSVLALGMTVAGPVSTAQAKGTGSFYLVNKATGTCLKGNGFNRNLTLGDCRASMAFQWKTHAPGKYASRSIGTLPGAVCMAANPKGGLVSLRSCKDGKGTAGWRIPALRDGARTTIQNPACGYLQSVGDKVAKCGKLTTDRNAITWVVKYAL